MINHHVQIPESAGATMRDYAEWVCADLKQRGAHSERWDERVYYVLPQNIKGEAGPFGQIHVSSLTDSALSVMPDCGANGAMIMRNSFAKPEEAGEVVRRIRIPLMREVKYHRARKARLAAN